MESYKDCTLLSVTNPIPIGESKIKKKFAIKLKYRDNAGKHHNKTVRFGNKGVSDFVDHKDIKKQNNLDKRMKNKEHWSQSNFWRDRVLNRKESVDEAFTAVIKELNLV